MLRTPSATRTSTSQGKRRCRNTHPKQQGVSSETELCDSRRKRSKQPRMQRESGWQDPCQPLPFRPRTIWCRAIQRRFPASRVVSLRRVPARSRMPKKCPRRQRSNRRSRLRAALRSFSCGFATRLEWLCPSNVYRYAFRLMASPIRVLTTVPICDGHDSAINTINLEFIRHGIEVIYLGYHRSVGDIVRAAIQEDVRAIGISSYNGGHIEFFAAVVDLLRKKGANDIKVFGGGGGTITHDDAAM